MKRVILATIVLTILLAGLSIGQGPLTNALSLQLRSDSNGALFVYGVPTGAQGPLTSLGNMQLRAYSPGALAVTLVAGSSFTAPFTLSNDGIVTTSTDALILSNATAATVGVPVQQSGRLRLRSNVWNTTAVAANNTNDFFLESVPVSGLVPSGLLKFGSSLNGAAATYPMTLTSGGTLAMTRLYTGDGTAALPAWAFSGENTLGFYRRTTNILTLADGVTSSGIIEYSVQTNLEFQRMKATNVIGWSSGNPSAAVADVGLSRQAAGILAVGTGLAGSAGSGVSGITAAFHNSLALSALTITTNTIAPTSSVHSVGAGLIKTITVPANCAPTCSITIIPTAAYTYDATGNVTVPVGGGLALISKTMTFTFDGTKWNPSY
jgi:hypothetical protein